MNPKIGTVKELLGTASKKLEEQYKTYEETEKEYMEILKAFGLESLVDQIPLELFAQNDMNFDFTHQIVAEKVNEESNKYFISRIEKNISELQSFNTSIMEYQKLRNKILHKYKSEYESISKNSHQDILNISSLQTDVHKLQAKIHQANEQQEKKNVTIANFQECFQIKSDIDKCKEEDGKLMKEMENYRPLPPDLAEAQNKLDQLQLKYRQISSEFTQKIQKGC